MRFARTFLFLLCILPLFCQATLRQSHQHKFNNNNINLSEQISSSSNRIQLQRDDSINKKISMFNFISKNQSILKGTLEFIQLDYDYTTLQIQKSIVKHKKETQKSSLLEKASSQKKGTIELINNGNTFYSGGVGVGDENSFYKMIFDTGSTLIFLNSVLCEDIGCQRGNQYDSEESSTFKDIDVEIQVTFGSGVLTGDMAKETFYVGGLEVKNMSFLEITEQDGAVFENGDFDGLVGLAFPSLGEGVDTLVDAMKNQKKISRKQYSFYLSREQESQDSFITFGEVDKSIVDGEIKYHKVESALYWTLLAEQIKVGDQDTGICSKETPCALAIDSGTSVLAGPTVSSSLLIQQIADRDFPCNEIADMPSISFVIDGEEYTLQANEYMISATETQASLYEHSTEAIACQPALIGLDVSEPKYGELWIIGDLFMSKFYTVFDREGLRVGFGKLKNINKKSYKVSEGKDEFDYEDD